MDFGVVRHNQSSPNEATPLGSSEPRNEDNNGSAMNLKHQISVEDNTWRLPKMQRPPSEVDFGRSNLWPNDGQKMLSFSSSSSSSQPCNGGNGSSRSIAFSICQDEHHTRIGGGLNEGIRGPFARVKGPFTPSQWMELEHHALIYKHIVANVPVPCNLLVPLKRSLYSYGSYPSNFCYSGSNDPEAGRCRRTDGKKWRCSRDAVPDQKYCERHINRGRHRSRKPVEGQTGHAATADASSHHPANNNRPQGFQGPSLISSPTIALKPKDTQFSIQKQHVQFEELAHSEFGLVSSDSLLNPTERISYMTTTNSDPHQVHHFIDDWPKNHSNRASGPTWPEEVKSDWTQLTMSITDFSSPSSSPAQEKSTISSLRLSHDMGNLIQKQPHSWLPQISWGNSMGGPLGEVLTSTASSSPQLGSSPTGVLQKATFGTLSNSSSGSSPRSGENNKGTENGGLCNGVLGSALLSSAAIPSL